MDPKKRENERFKTQCFFSFQKGKIRQIRQIGQIEFFFLNDFERNCRQIQFKYLIKPFKHSKNMSSSQTFPLKNPSVYSIVLQNQLSLYSQMVDDRYEAQIKSIEERTKSFLDNIVQTKHLILETFPKEMLNLTVENFLTEHHGSFEALLKARIKKMGVLEKNQIAKSFSQNQRNFERNHYEGSLEKIPEFIENSRENFEDCLQFTEKKMEHKSTGSQCKLNFQRNALKSPSTIYTPYSKKKIDFSETSVKTPLDIAFDGSVKKHWVP